MEATSVPNSRDKKITAPIMDFVKRSVLKYLDKLDSGTVVVEDGSDIYRYVGSDPAGHSAVIRVMNPNFYVTVFTRGSVGAAEAYMNGEWTTPDLLKVVLLFSSNMKLLSSLKMKRFMPMHLIEKYLHKINDNSKDGSRQNISKHYDLGNDFFSQFLDETMMYSSAIFDSQHQTLLTASVNKIDKICKTLELKPGDHLLEIGTGWGGFALHAAKHYGCKVTTTTISRRQYDYTSQKIKEQKLEGSITLLLKDYRDLSGEFDKIVSIEMIEAVGYKYYSSYFGQCNRLLKKDGLMLLQAITMPGQRYQQAKKSVDFIQKYIFPGGCLPSVEAICESVTKHTDMQMVHLSDITLHYAETLKRWREAFNLNAGKVRELGFDDRFFRMWNYYLCYCEGGFRERIINTNHILLAKNSK